nr:MAG TPA: Hint [Caudoviricetes sp.]
MIILKEIKQSKVLVIGESYNKVSDDALPFIDEQSSLALRVGFQTSAPENFVTPDFIEINNPLNVDLDQSTIDSLKDLFNLYEYIVCVGRTPLKAWFNSLSKGRSMETITNSPFLEPLEYPKLKVGVLPHFKSAFSKDSEDPLSDYWDKIKYLFADKPNYNCTEIKINNEQEFVQLLHFLDTLPNDTILGLDYETNAVDQFNVDFRVTMYGLAYLVDKHNAKGFWYHPPKNEPLSDFAMQHWKAFLDRNHKRIWAYNVPFEIKTTWDQVGEMYRMQDAMVLMTVQGKRGSLKNIMRSELGASLWESSVHEFMDITEAMFKYTKRSKNRDTIEEMFKNHDLEGLRKLHKNFDKWFDMILEDYEESDILHAIDNYPYPWASVPPNVLGPYCAKDAGFALLLVANYLTDEYKQAYEFYMNHPWLATKFEVNGCPWDDGIATTVKADLSKQALDRLYNVIMNLDTISQEQKMLAKDTYFKELPYEIISYTEKQKKEKRTQIKSDLDKVEILKTIFNPNSNTEDSRKLFWDSYLTNDITLGTIMNIFIEDMEFNQALKPLYDILGHDFIKTNSIQVILEKISDPDKFIIDKNLSNQCKKSLQKAISEYKDMLGKFSTDLIKNQYQVHKRWLGLKIDNEETWSKNWRLVFDLFLFKKITKTISTNIDGKTGRSLVTEIVGRKWGKPLRGRYWEDKPEDESWDNKETILNNSFNSLSADTLRWSSSFHTVPQSNPIRSILHPNENGYLMFHCLEGNTEIITDKGNIKIKDLVARVGSGEIIRVKARKSDKLKHEAKLQPISRVFESKKVTETIKLTFENGESVECTPDHKFLTKDGIWIEAKDIDENTDLMESCTERRRQLEEYVKNGGTMNARDPYYPLDTIAKERYCRCCNKWISSFVFMKHIENDHNLSFKDYCYKFNSNLEKEDIKPCPYCNSGKLVGYFTKDNNGSILKLCNSSKECYDNFYSSIFRDKFKYDEEFKRKSIERGSKQLKEINSDPIRRKNVERLASEKLKDMWANDSSYRNKMVKAVKDPFHNGTAGLNFIRTSRNQQRILPYGRTYNYSHLYIAKLSDEILKIGIFYEDKTRRLQELKDASDNFELLKLVKFKGTVAFDVESALLLESWKDFTTYDKFKSTETRFISCLDKVISRLDEVLLKYFKQDSDGYYSELDKDKLYTDIVALGNLEWEKVKNENSI